MPEAQEEWVLRWAPSPDPFDLDRAGASAFAAPPSGSFRTVLFTSTYKVETSLKKARRLVTYHVVMTDELLLVRRDAQ